jgi:hypothetical protein
MMQIGSTCSLWYKYGQDAIPKLRRGRVGSNFWVPLAAVSCVRLSKFVVPCAMFRLLSWAADLVEARRLSPEGMLLLVPDPGDEIWLSLA